MLQSSRLNVFILAPRMGVTDVMLQPFLEGWPLHQVIEAKRLFMVDLEILQGLPCKSEEYVVNNDTFIIHCGNSSIIQIIIHIIDWFPFVSQCPVPIALFFVNGDGRLVPIAIQLFQQKADDNPVRKISHYIKLQSWSVFRKFKIKIVIPLFI